MSKNYLYGDINESEVRLDDKTNISQSVLYDGHNRSEKYAEVILVWIETTKFQEDITFQVEFISLSPNN